jgi:hypothetical protein
MNYRLRSWGVSKSRPMAWRMSTGGSPFSRWMRPLTDWRDDSQAYHSISELEPSGPILISKAFDFPLFGSTPTTPQFIFPTQQLQGLFTLGRGLYDIIEERNPEQHVETVKSLASIDKIPVPLRRLEDLLIRQRWRLQDSRDGGGLGFTVELFGVFLTLRQFSSAQSSPELKQVFYIGTFKVIT